MLGTEAGHLVEYFRSRPCATCAAAKRAEAAAAAAAAGPTLAPQAAAPQEPPTAADAAVCPVPATGVAGVAPGPQVTGSGLENSEGACVATKEAAAVPAGTNQASSLHEPSSSPPTSTAMAASSLHIHRVHLSMGPERHGAMWREAVVPRLYAAVAAILAIRRDPSRRQEWLGSGPLEKWHTLEALCPFIVPMQHAPFAHAVASSTAPPPSMMAGTLPPHAALRLPVDAPPLKCPNCSGSLRSFLTAHGGFGCDGCGCRVPLGALCRGCRACDFDLCDGCATASKSGLSSALPSSLPSPSLPPPPTSSPSPATFSR